MMIFTFSVVSIMCFAAFMFLGIQSFTLDRKNPINQAFLLYCLSAGILAFFEFMARQAIDPVRGALWINLQQAAPIAAITSVHFMLEFAKINRRNLRIIFHILLYLPFFIYLFFLAFTGLFTVNAVLTPWGFAFGSYKTPGYIAYLPLVWMVVLNLISVFIALTRFLSCRECATRKTSLYVLAAMTLPFAGAALQNIVLKGTGSFPSTITLFTFVSAAFIALAIYRHNLFKINPSIAAENIIRMVDSYILLVDDQGIIRNANPAVCGSLGLRDRDLIEKRAEIIFMHGFIPEFISQAGVMAGKLKPVKNLETCLKTASGSPLYVLLSISPIYDSAGIYHGYVLAATDISRRISLENDLLAEITRADMANTKLEESNQKLKELDRLKKNFIAMVSHELRTPLTSIKGFLSFLSHGVGGGLSDKQREFTDTMGFNVEKLLKLINELLDFSKIDSGTFSIDKKQSDLIAALNKSIAEMSPIAEKRQIKIINPAKPASLPGIFDEIRIGQVIINLLNNAVKYTYSRTSIFVDASMVTDPVILLPGHLKSAEIPKGRYFLLSVRDEGPGIDPKYCSKIFDQFFQIEDANTRKHEGVGLGLNISMNIIKAHNGLIWAESEGKNKGAVFSFLIPVL